MDGSQSPGYIGLSERFCEGTRDPSKYVCLVTVSAATVRKGFAHEGSSELDRIHAFDLSETQGAYFGQLNLVHVSSFCGPDGLVWGYDIADARPQDEQPIFTVGTPPVPVLSAEPLLAATKGLVGTLGDPRFPVMPGSICPAAYSVITAEGPTIVYAAFGIGIRADGSCGASVVMEDKGKFSLPADPSAKAAERERLVTGKVAESILAVARNQRISFREIRVAYRETVVGDNEVGCGFAAMPYLALARRAVPDGGIDTLRRMSLDEWAADRGLINR